MSDPMRQLETWARDANHRRADLQRQLDEVAKLRESIAEAKSEAGHLLLAHPDRQRTGVKCRPELAAAIFDAAVAHLMEKLNAWEAEVAEQVKVYAVNVEGLGRPLLEKAS